MWSNLRRTLSSFFTSCQTKKKKQRPVADVSERDLHELCFSVKHYKNGSVSVGDEVESGHAHAAQIYIFHQIQHVVAVEPFFYMTTCLLVSLQSPNFWFHGFQSEIF